MEKIQIKCTSCDQKFAVSESYKGKMVECGACDHRFKVEGSAIMRQKRKYYPGEKSALNVNEFNKASDSDDTTRKPAAPVKFEPADYSQFPSTNYAAPASPRRTVAIVIGAVLIILIILLFLFGGRADGALQDINDTKRLLLACFIAVLGSSLIMYGSRRKKRGMLLSLLLGGSLVAMPFIFRETLTPERVSDTEVLGNDDEVEKPISENDIEKAYADDIGYHEVIRLRKKAVEQDLDPTIVKAIVLKTVGPHIDTIQFYLKNKLQLDSVPSTYTIGRKLDNRPIILMIFDSEASTEEILSIVKRFGSPEPMNDMRSDLGVIEVGVDHRQFASQDANILTNEEDPNYFMANYIELNSMDRTKQLEAIKRLNKTKTSLGRRSDIATRLASMISENDKKLSTEAIKTLNKWTMPAYDLDGIVFEYAKVLSPKETLDIAVMDYLVDKQVKGCSSILAEQWLRPAGNLRWEDQILRAKSEGELAIIIALPKAPANHVKSAAAILKKIGTAKSIPVLRSTASKLDKENANYLKATIDEIKSRQ